MGLGIVSQIDRCYEPYRALCNAVVAAGGNDEDVFHGLLRDAACLETVVKALVGPFVPGYSITLRSNRSITLGNSQLLEIDPQINWEDVRNLTTSGTISFVYRYVQFTGMTEPKKFDVPQVFRDGFIKLNRRGFRPASKRELLLLATNTRFNPAEGFPSTMKVWSAEALADLPRAQNDLGVCLTINEERKRFLNQYPLLEHPWTSEDCIAVIQEINTV